MVWQDMAFCSWTMHVIFIKSTKPSAGTSTNQVLNRQKKWISIVLLKNMAIKSKKGHFKRLAGDVLGGSLCHFFTDPHSRLPFSTNQDHYTMLNR